MFPLLLLLLLPSISADDVCSAPLAHGSSPCPTNAPSTRFHLDPLTERCLAFAYTGCGGNENNFETLRECRQRCVPQDRLGCAANTAMTRNEEGGTRCATDGPKCDDDGSFCHLGAHGEGVCCSKDSKEKVHRDHSKTCPNGKPKYLLNDGGHPHVLLGKSCSGSPTFCPSGYQCEMGNFYAFCCEIELIK